MGDEVTAADEKMGSERIKDSSSKADELHQHEGALADAASFPSLEEQNKQLTVARASLQQQQERRRQQQQQQDQQATEGASESDAEAEAGAEADTCSYCGVAGTDILLRCATCNRYFCNSGPRGGPSHVVHHLVKSKHREIRFHSQGSLAEAKLECFVCGIKNVLQLGMIIAEGRGVVLIVCRDKCYAGGILEQNGWDSKQWQPLIEKKAFATWLVRPLTKHERISVSPVTREEMELLEERWAKDAHATVVDIRTEGSVPLDNAQLMYEDSISYQRTYAPLVHAEAEVNKQRTLQEIAENVAVTWEVNRHGRVKASFILEDDRLSWTVGVGEEFKVFGKVPRALLRSSEDQSAANRNGTVVDTMAVNWHACLCVTSVNKLSGVIEGQVYKTSHAKEGPWDDNMRTYSLQSLWNPIARDRMIRAVTSFATNDRSICPYLHDLILGKLQVAPTAQIEVPATLSAPNLPTLNHSQIEAVTYALQHRLSLIQGPPGTGKTLTAASLVYQLWATKPRGSGILVSASSNVAVDNLAEKIHLTGLKVVRVYSRQREGADASVGSSAVPLEHLALHKLAENAQTARSEEYLALKRKKARDGDLDITEEKRLRVLQLRCEAEVLQAADVVCCTCIGAGDKRIGDFQFKNVVIDESTQATEPETLVPLVLGADHVVLIGDQCQMGPLLQSRAARASGLGVSLFVRMLLLRHPSSRLSVQYSRMHPGLSYFPSQCYYEGSLQNGVTSSQRHFNFVPSAPFKWPSQNFPSFFYHCSTEEELSSTGTSYLNRGEASVVERLVIALVKRGASPAQIGVITPYIGQRNYLKTLLQRHPVRADVELSSVDAFQGREKDIIIFSCVRSNAQCTIGFLSDPRRLNVALTRARFCLFICGNADLLSVSMARFKGRRGTSGEGEEHSAAFSQRDGDCQEQQKGPCELLQLAEAELVGLCDVWPLLLMHYSKKGSVVTGPIFNLRPVAVRGRRTRELPPARGKLSAVSGVEGAGSSEAAEEIARPSRALSVGGGLPDYPLTLQEADKLPGSSTVGQVLQAAADEEFAGSRFDL
ncbi:hypothetical protein Efla_005058 [Eimeria flavescens]